MRGLARLLLLVVACAPAAVERPVQPEFVAPGIVEPPAAAPILTGKPRRD